MFELQTADSSPVRAKYSSTSTISTSKIHLLFLWILKVYMYLFSTYVLQICLVNEKEKSVLYKKKPNLKRFVCNLIFFLLSRDFINVSPYFTVHQLYFYTD